MGGGEGRERREKGGGREDRGRGERRKGVFICETSNVAALLPSCWHGTAHTLSHRYINNDPPGPSLQEGLPPLETLNDMQCNWFEIAMARAYLRMGRVGDALKKCHQIDKVEGGVVKVGAWSLEAML